MPWSWVWLASMVCAGPSLAAAQERFDGKRYQKELAPGRPVASRLEALADVAFHDSEDAAEFLLEEARRTLAHVAELEERRAENDERIRRSLEPQILAAKKSGGSINIAGLERFQEMQEHLGAQITAEEQVLRGFADALGSLKSDAAVKVLLSFQPRGERLRDLWFEVLGRVHRQQVTEFLMSQLSAKELDVRLGAVAALRRHDPALVPPQAFGALLSAREWPARAMAVEALAAAGGRAALELLVLQTTKESGRQLADLCVRLEQMTGQTFGKNPQAWLDWWEQNKDTLETTSLLVTQPVRRQEGGGKRYFGVELESLRVVFVLDISQTMGASLDDPQDLFPPEGKSRLDMARREVKAAILALPPDAVFAVIAYNDVVLEWQDSMQPATPGNKQAALQWLDQLAAVSATNVYDALETAFRLSEPGTKDRYYDRAADTILFVSDGGPTAGRTTDCDEILEQVRAWHRIKPVKLYAVGIGDDINQSFLTRLAETTGGTATFR